MLRLSAVEPTVLTSLTHILELTLIGNLHLIKLYYLLLTLNLWCVVLILIGFLAVTYIIPSRVLRNPLKILLLLKSFLKIENIYLIDIFSWITLTFHQLLVDIITVLKVHSIHICFNLILYWHLCFKLLFDKFNFAINI